MNKSGLWPFSVFANEVKQSSTELERSIELDCFASARNDDIDILNGFMNWLKSSK